MLSTFFRRLTAIVAVGMICYHFFYIVALPYETSINAIVHLGLAFSVLLLAQLSLRFRLTDLILLGVGIAATIYFFSAYDIILEDPSYPPDAAAYAGIAAAVIAFYLTYRTFGLVFPLVALIAVTYLLFGSSIPGALKAPSMDLERLLTLLVSDVTSPWGLYGSLLILSANYLFLFIIFGSVLEAFGGLRFIMCVGNAAARHFRSGAASLSVISSALLGSITGSTVANITVTGTFTIPLMKKSNYTPEQAAAIETAASCGGQILPPVMGATVFIMSGFTGIPYIDIVKASVFSAILYFGQLLLYAELNAAKRHILPMKGEKVDMRELLLSAPVFILPLILLLVLLLTGLSLMKTIFYCIIAVVGIGLFCNLFQQKKLNFGKVLEATVKGTVSGSQIAVVLAVIGIAVACVEVSGIGMKLGTFLVGLSQNNLLLLLLMTALTAIVLGIGLPSPAAYIICATVLSPALVKIGVPLLIAHLFPLYYALFSHLTPPVGIGLMVACKMANSRYSASALEALKAAMPSFLLPFLFVYAPELLLRGSTGDNAAVIAGTALFFVCLAVLLNTYAITRLRLPETLLVLPALVTLGLFLCKTPHPLLLLALGTALLASALLVQIVRQRKSRGIQEY